MQSVKRSWLLLLNWSFVVFGSLYIAAAVILNNLDMPDAAQTWGMTLFVVGICGIQLLYGITIFPWFSKRNLWLASILNLIVYAMFFSAIIETSGRDNYVLRIGFIVFMFLTAMVGLFPPIGGIVITWAIYVLILIGSIESTTQEIVTTGFINLAVTISGIVGWLVFRNYYIKDDAKEVVVMSHKLEQEKYKSSVILDSITDGVMIISPQGTVEVLNKSAAKLLGWTHKDAILLDYRSLVKTTDSVSSNNPTPETAIELCLKTKKATQKNSLLTTNNQRRLYVDIVASPILGPPIKDKDTGIESQEMIGVIAVLRDVDKQTRQEQQRSDFISTASHEMRTPVASIQGYLELALNPKAAVIDDKAKSYLVKAHESTRHLGALFQDLLTASQSEDGRLVNSPQVIDIVQFVQSVVEQEQVSADKKNLNLVFEKDFGKERNIAPLLYVYIDPDRLREVLLNLIENAIKYTEAGMVTVGVSLSERSVVIRVADTGIGIAQEDLDHIFQKFYRTDNTKTRQAGGTGLGLYIAQQIVDMVHGRIWAESTPGEGSTFYVELPRISSEEVARIQNQEKT